MRKACSPTYIISEHDRKGDFEPGKLWILGVSKDMIFIVDRKTKMVYETNKVVWSDKMSYVDAF